MQVILIFLAGLLAGFFGATVGGGGMIIVPTLLFCGLTPQQAVAATKMGSTGSATSSFIKYYQAGYIQWKWVPYLTIISIAGSWYGANLLLDIDTKLVTLMIGAIILLLLPLVLLKKEVGVVRRSVSKVSIAAALVLYVVWEIYHGFLGPGGGTLILYTMIFLMGQTMLEAKATHTIPWIAVSLTTVGVLAANGHFLITEALTALAGMSIGGYVGAHLAVVKGNAWVKLVFGVIVTISGVKLLLSSV